MPKPVILIYDARCSLCCGCMKWIERHAKSSDEFEFVKCKSEEHMKRFHYIKEEACLEFLHLILPDKQILIGDKSLPEIVSRLKNLQWLAILFKIPGIRLVLYLVYRFISNNRFIISQTILPITHGKDWDKG